MTQSALSASVAVEGNAAIAKSETLVRAVGKELEKLRKEKNRR